MYSTFTTIYLLSAIFTTSLAQSNVTVPETDPSIKYEGTAAHTTVCPFNGEGVVIVPSEGCVIVNSKCTTSAAMGQTKDAAASFKFKGSAIYINSLLFDRSPLYSVTLDGKSVDVDGVRPSQGLTCDTLFSQAGLDPHLEHEIRLSIKDVSPTRNQTKPDLFAFALTNFIYTTDNTTSTPTKSSGSDIGIPQLAALISFITAFAFY